MQALLGNGRRIAMVAMVLMSIGVTACGGIPEGVYTSSKLSAMVYAGLGSDQQKGYTQTSVSCQTDEQLIGGGFRVNTRQGQPIQIVASYPSDYQGNQPTDGFPVTTWTVIGYSATGGGGIAADAICAQPRYKLSVAIVARQQSVHAGGVASVVATCQQGRQLVGGGFASDAPKTNAAPTLHVVASAPQDGGWLVTMRAVRAAHGNGSFDSWAVCVSGALTVGAEQRTATFNGDGEANTDGYCNPGEMVTGGGFSAVLDSDAEPFQLATDAPDVSEHGLLIWEFEGTSPRAAKHIIKLWVMCGVPM